MNLSDVLTMLRRRWVTFVIALLAVIGAAVAALLIQTPIYEATATLSLTPKASSGGSIDQAITLLPQISAITPAYAEAVTADDTQRLARTFMPAGRVLAGASVATFQSAPTVLKISARSPRPRDAQLSAAAYVRALQQRSSSGEIGPADLLEVLQIDSPRLPTAAVSPRKKLTIGVGIMLGLIVAFLAAWLRDQGSGAVEDAEMLGQAAGVPVFGVIPDTRRVPAVHSIDALLTDDRMRYVSEAMRDLAVALQLTQLDSDSVLITSPATAQGKTTVAFGFAVSLARSGVDTLLVDGDLRRGRLEELFADDPVPVRKTPGFENVLRGMPLDDAVQHTSNPRLHVLTSGELLDDPSELLDAAFPTVLRDMERQYAVVIDATPLMPINDARIMAKFCGTTLLVVSAGQVSRREVRRGVERLKIIGVTPTAAVLNRSKDRESSRNSAYLAPRTSRAQ
jgi:capsular exopolysaccharide synthesis family protein